MLADNKMFDFLNSVISSSDYLEEVKQPSLKIKDMVAKRIAFIQEIRVLFP
jgi:hypothetical protein